MFGRNKKKTKQSEYAMPNMNNFGVTDADMNDKDLLVNNYIFLLTFIYIIAKHLCIYIYIFFFFFFFFFFFLKKKKKKKKGI